MNTTRFPIHFIGAGPGAEDLITERGAALLKEADVVVYAGSLVNPGHLKRCRPEAELHDSAKMNLEEQVEVMARGALEGKKVVRLHAGVLPQRGEAGRTGRTAYLRREVSRHGGGSGVPRHLAG